MLGRDFTRLWAASTTSNLGDGIYSAALPLLVASLTRDPFSVAAATVANRIPWLLFALISGALVDRMDRQRVMVITDIFRGVLVAVLAILVAAGTLQLSIIYLIAFALGTAETFFDTSSEAILPAIVDRDVLPTANGRLQATEWAGNAFIGPPIGALLFTATTSLPFFVDAATFLVAAALIAAIRGNHRTDHTPGQTLRGDIGEGLTWLWRHSVLRTLSILAGLTNLVGFGILAIFVLFIQDEIGMGDVGFGIIMSTIGFGGLAGALMASRVAARLGRGTTLLVSLASLGINAVIIGTTTSPIVAGIIGFSYGVFITAWNVVAVSLRQALTPDELRGRIASVSRLLAWGSQPIGALLGGLIAARWGLRAPFYFGVVIWGVTFLGAIPLINNRRIEELEAQDVATG